MTVSIRIGRPFNLAVLVAIALPASAHGQTAEERIKQLEQRLLQMERRLAAAEAKANSAQRAATSNKRTAPEARQAAATAPGGGAAAAQTGDVLVAKPEVANDNPEFSVVRENVATLSSRSFEIAAGIGYTKNASLLQSDRAFTSFISGRYGIFDGVELGVNLPYYYSYRYTQVSPTELEANRAASMGDTLVQVTALVSKETPNLPAVNATIGAVIPTGARPYYFGEAYRPGNNPIDPLFGRQSRGEWGAFGNVQFVKTYDPVVLFAGFGAEYSFATAHQGYEVEWPIRFNYNAGFSFIMSNTSTLGFALIGSYQGDVRVNGARAKNTQSEPIVGRLTLTQRLAPNFYIEPSVGIGLSKDTPQVSASLTVRKRF